MHVSGVLSISDLRGAHVAMALVVGRQRPATAALLLLLVHRRGSPHHLLLLLHACRRVAAWLSPVGVCDGGGSGTAFDERPHQLAGEGGTCVGSRRGSCVQTNAASGAGWEKGEGAACVGRGHGSTVQR
jgi:hypothetical protein